MENSNVKERILVEIDNLISVSCPKQRVPQKFKNLHVDLLKKYYNAANVSIDYHRRRVEMDIVMDDRDYHPRKVNLCVPTLHANLFFRNLCDYLKSCVDRDNKSLAFYAGLLRSYAKKDIKLSVA